MPKYVVFRNPGEIDPRLIATFGANVKESNNPIGFFGTGLKYAISILLRNHCSIMIQSGMNQYTFRTQTENIRGKDFAMVYMGTKPMGFTLELGKNWAFWTAYRELYSNCADEKGEVAVVDQPPAMRPGVTSVVVGGQAFLDVHEDRSTFFLQGEPLLKPSYLSIFPGKSNSIYYRGIKIGDTPSGKPTLYSYNFRVGLTLTEDRTYRTPWEVSTYLAAGLSTLTDKNVIKRIITCGPEYHEWDIDWTGRTFTTEFLEAVRDCVQKDITCVSESLYQAWRSASVGKFEPIVREPTEIEKIMLASAIGFIKAAGFDVERFPILVSTELGGKILGLAFDGKIYLSHTAFEGGMKQLIITVLEEFIHLHYGVRDESRQMQERLLHLLISAHERIQGTTL